MKADSRRCAHGYGFCAAELRAGVLPERERVRLLPACGVHAHSIRCCLVRSAMEFRFRIRYSFKIPASGFPPGFEGQWRGRRFARHVVNADGNRNFTYLNENDGRWYLNWNRVGNDLNQNGRVASARNLRLMALHYPGGPWCGS